MGEDSTGVRFDFNGSVRVAARGEQLSGNAGAMLLRAVDDAVGVTKQLAQDLHDPRDPSLVQYRLSELLRTRLQMIALGFLIVGDAGEPVLHGTRTIGLYLLCLSAVLTLYTGWDYMKAGLKHVTEE